jgi:hypothetical protein
MFARAILRSLPLLLAVAAPLGCAMETPSETGAGDEVSSTSSAIGSGAKGWGFAWVDPANPSVSTTYAYDSAGGTITYNAVAGIVGQYVVHFPGLGRYEGHVQVSAYGGTNQRCVVKSWGPPSTFSTTLDVTVACTAANGTPAASAFTVWFNNENAPSSTNPYSGGAYLWTQDNAGTVGAAYSWNTTGGTNTVSHVAGTNRYTINFAGQTFSNATVHVTAYGDTDGRHCQVGGWGNGTSVAVYCFTAAGNPTEARFTALFTGSAAKQFVVGGHAWLDYAGAAAPGYSGAMNEISCFSSTVTASSAALPYHRDVTFTGVGGPYNATALTTSYGSDGSYCKVAGWNSGSTTGSAKVTVKCFDKTGVAKSAMPATVSFTKGLFSGPC